jgi:hypothetical protein
MTETSRRVRRLIERMIEGRRQAAQRRVDAYLEALGLGERRDRQ